MFALARWGGRAVSRMLGARDDELFTILFFGLAVAFGGIGDLLGVSDAIGAFLIGLVLGATRFRTRIEGFALPLRDIFGAFFFLNFGLALDPSSFGGVLWPVGGAVLMTLVVNAGGGWLIAWLNRMPARFGLGIGLILQNRGEFALILATLATGAGLDPRLTPFAGLYVLVMSIIGPLLTVNSERITDVLYRVGRRKTPVPQVDSGASEAIALMEGAIVGQESSNGDDSEDESDGPLLDSDSPVPQSPPVPVFASDREPENEDHDDADFDLDATIQQAMEQSDQQSSRKRDPEY
jgi:CPA2 family monovalent cation:H+ antiporter-2